MQNQNTIEEKDELVILPSINNEYDDYDDEDRIKKSTWLRRTFSKMQKGGLRGNMFLMIITTTGCAFFFLPYQGKKTGLLLTTILLIFPAAVSYYSSSLLYLGFKTTQAKTYDECMKKILGDKFGLLSNILIFIHTFAAVVSVWLFSFEFLNNAILKLLKMSKEKSKTFSEIFFYSFCGFIMSLLYISSLTPKVEKLKKISLIGLLIIIYLIIVFVAFLPDYFEYYKNEIYLVPYKFDQNTFKTAGICFYLFLNQYTVIPICNNLKNVTSKRITKVVRRTNFISLTIYLFFLFIGYFSMPDDVGIEYQLFLNRPSINNNLEVSIIIGQILFGINLIIAVLVKGHFYLLYYNQIIRNVSDLFKKNKKKTKIEETLITEEENIKEENDIKPGQKRQRYNTFVSEKSDFQQTKTLQTEENLQTQQLEQLMSQSLDLNQRRDSDFQKYGLTTDVISFHQKKIEEKKYFSNFLFLAITTLITILLKDCLHEFVSCVGSFVGIFEIVVFPFSILLVLNSYNKLLNICHLILLFIISIIFICLAFTAFLTNILYQFIFQLITIYYNMPFLKGYGLVANLTMLVGFGFLGYGSYVYYDITKRTYNVRENETISELMDEIYEDQLKQADTNAFIYQYKQNRLKNKEKIEKEQKTADI